MDRWVGRVGLVTGASSGIGRAIAARLAQLGMVVVACARNYERLQELKAANADAKGTIVPVRCDVRNEEEILSMFDLIRREFGGVDVCVNNAGVGLFATLLSGSTADWRDMLEVNLLGTAVCAREAIKSMLERGVDDGFVINIGSIGGHNSSTSNGLAVYSGTKHALAMMTKATASELSDIKSRIKCVEISPGLVETEIFAKAIGEALADQLYASVEGLKADDISDCVVFMLSAPLRARVSELIIETADALDLDKFKMADS